MHAKSTSNFILVIKIVRNYGCKCNESASKKEFKRYPHKNFTVTCEECSNMRYGEEYCLEICQIILFQL